MRRFRPLLPALVLGCLGWSAPALAQSAGRSAPHATEEPDPAAVIDVHTIDPHQYRAIALRIREGQAPRIDGELDDEVWQIAPAFGDFLQREPVVGAPATERTEFRVR